MNILQHNRINIFLHVNYWHLLKLTIQSTRGNVKSLEITDDSHNNFLALQIAHIIDSLQHLFFLTANYCKKINTFNFWII